VATWVFFRLRWVEVLAGSQRVATSFGDMHAHDQPAGASFDDADSRSGEMDSQLEAWAEELINLLDEAAASQEFQEWLDVQSRFHDYSHRNSLLIELHCPEATKVAGYRTWQEEFDRHVQEGKQAIWILARSSRSNVRTAGIRPRITRTVTASTTRRRRRMVEGPPRVRTDRGVRRFPD